MAQKGKRKKQKRLEQRKKTENRDGAISGGSQTIEKDKKGIAAETRRQEKKREKKSTKRDK